ncbi:MAG: sodium:calcium antiporter [Archaeoglobaceae archaeon]
MRAKIQLSLALAATIPWLASFVMKYHYPPEVEALLAGSAVVGAAFLISWAAETAEIDVPRSFSLAVVALLAILPEYAVDAYFAWMAGKVGGDYVHYATANMTGANRLLIGVGWSLVVLIAMLKLKRRDVELDERLNLEIFFLLAATIYSFKIPLFGEISLFDSVVLISLFAAYVFAATRAEREEVELVGVPMWLASFSKSKRRSAVVLLMAYAAFTIFISVEAFAEGLIATAKNIGIDEFIVVQWVAPLASEAPEFVIAIYLVNRLRVAAAMNALISSKVNQWSLLIGTIAVVYSVSLMQPHPLPLDARQREEVFLTAAQSLFGLAVILDRRINVFEALLLLALFVTQLAIPSYEVRLAISAVYVILGVPILFAKRRELPKILAYTLSLHGRKF